jgi:uncharacterized phiE125 gp8 family phage protein
MPVSVVAAKAHLRIDHNDDAVVEGLIRRGLISTGTRCRQSHRQPDLAVDMSAFADPVRSPLTPVRNSITYFDALNATQTAAGTGALHRRARQLRAAGAGAARPAVYARSMQSALFVAGHGAAAQFRTRGHLILLLVGHWYENREGVVVGPSVAPLPMAVEALLVAKKRWVV